MYNNTRVKHHVYKHAKAIELTALIIIAIICFYILRLLGLNFEVLSNIIREQGIWGQIVFVLYGITAAVIAPLNTIILMPLLLSTYGLWLTITLTFIANFIGGLACFLIAKNFGRPFMKNFVPKKAMKEIDHFSKVSDWKSFLFIRLLGGNYYDYVSYAAGLTKISFKTYTWVTLITCLAWTSFSIYIIYKATIVGPPDSLAILGSSYITSVFGGAVIVHKYHKE